MATISHSGAHGLPSHPPSESSGGKGLNLGQRLSRQWYWTLSQGLPLYRREMFVQSHQARTYIFRVSFAVVLFGFGLLATMAQTGSSFQASAFQSLGQGKYLLDAMVGLLFALVYILGPALSAGTITQERERQALPLLYLTRLSPWHIVGEKFLSRLVPILTNLLLAVPLLVFAYAFGGANLAMLGTAVFYLAVTAIQVTSISLFASTISQRTTNAFILAYGLLLILYFGPAIVELVAAGGELHRTYSILQTDFTTSMAATATAATTTATTTAGPAGAVATQTTGMIPSHLIPYCLIPPAIFIAFYNHAYLATGFDWNTMLFCGYPSLLVAVAALVGARFLVYYRAFDEGPTPFVGALLKQMGRLSPSYISPRNLARSTATLIPEHNPISWRDSEKRTANWLPLVLLLEIPTVVILLWLVRATNWGPEAVHAIVLVYWLICVLIITIHTSQVINYERSQQTLDLLLTTPLSSQELVQQKFEGTFRLMRLCSIPLLTCILFQAWWRTESSLGVTDPELQFHWWEYVALHGVGIVLFFQLAAWVSLRAGLKKVSPIICTLEALLSLLICCVLPALIMSLGLLITLPIDLAADLHVSRLLAFAFSPVTVIGATEMAPLRQVTEIPLLAALWTALVYGYLLRRVRKNVLDQADKHLGRTVYY